MLNLNEIELKRIDNIKKVINGELTQKDASIKMGITDRQVRRLITKFKSEGELGLIHKNRGKLSDKKIPIEVANQIIDDYLNNYPNYNFSHYYEEQGVKYGISFSAMISIFQENDIISPLAQHKTVRNYNENMKKAIKEKTITECQKKLFDQRQKEEKEKHVRRSTLHYSFGEEIQMDAAFWIWFGTEETALHLAVDKATKKVLYGWFSYEETTETYLILLMNMVINHGIPKKIKTDKRSSFSVNNARSSKTKLNVTQFGRICEDLEIILECNSNPLFKPNVERENGVFKGRLKAELEHNNITSLEDANNYLINVFIPKMNKRFSYDIDQNKNLMRENNYSLEELNIIISTRDIRVIDNASSIKYLNEYYVPFNQETGEIISFPKGTECNIVITYDKQLHSMVDDNLYSLLKIDKPKPKVYEKVETKKYTGHKPAENHPWRNNMMMRH